MLLIVIISAFTKRAQFPFSSWLPAAIAAPTPVSSLVHSSTLVTAGVYLLIRFHYLIYEYNKILNIIILVRLITIIFSGISANIEFDIKKIIAFSTLSQLGLIILIFRFKNWELRFFHLIIHAIFKSLIFICSGIIIHSILNHQDIRYIGKFIRIIPVRFRILLISNLSLCGIPFISGFYSKDQILERMFILNNNLIIYLFILIRTGLTVSYRIRILYYLLFKTYNNNPINLINEFKIINYPILILLFISILFGITINYIVFNNIENIYIAISEKLIIIIICIIFILIRILILKNYNFRLIYFIKYFFAKIWFLNNFIPIIIIIPLKLGKKYYKYFDKGWREILFKNSIIIIYNNINYFNKYFNKFNIILILISINLIIIFIIYVIYLNSLI